MAFTDNLNELWGIPELEAQKERAIQLVKEYLQEVTAASKKMRSLQFGIGGMESMAQMKANAKEVETLTNQQIKSIKALADAKLKEAKAEEALSRARLNAYKMAAAEAKKAAKDESDLLKKQAKEETHNASTRKKIFAQKRAADKQAAADQKKLEQQTKANTKAIFDYNKQIEKATTDAAKQSNAYELLKKQYRDAANEAKRLGAELGVDSARFKEAAASAHAMHTQLLTIEGSVGQMQRQVGAYNMVGAQFNQLLRELPNAGISARTFVMAISNNITYFAESVKEARAQGTSWMGILKTLGSSLFSVVGVMNIALTVFTLWALNSDKAAESTQTLTERVDDLTDATIRYIQAANQQNQIIRGGFNQGSQAQQRYIDLLVAQGASEAEIAKERAKFHKIRINEFNAEIQQYNDVEKAVIDYAKAVQRGGDSIDSTQERLNKLMRDGLGLSADEAAEQAKKIRDVSTALAEDGKKISLDSFEFLQGVMFERLQLEESVKDELSAIEVERADFEKKSREKSQKDAEKAIRAYYKRLRDIEKERGAPALMPTLDDINNQIKEYENAGLANRLSQAIFGNEQDEKKALTALENQFAQGLISAEDYEAERLRIQNDFATQRIQLEIETTKKLLANSVGTEEERLKLISRINDLELELAKQGRKDKLKEEEEYKKASLQLEKERADRIKQIRMELTNAVLQFGRYVIDKERERLEESKQRIDEEKEVEIARINATSDNEKQAAERRFALEQRSLANKQQIQKKEEQLERKRFLLEQAGALARVLINANEAVGKITAQAAVLSSNPVTAPLAANAYAQIPLVYGSAAVQAGLIAAQTLAYAEGTPEGGHKGGDAIVGEAGESEYVKEPGKAGYWVTKPTLFKNMAKGTEVIPLHKLEAQGMEAIALNAMIQGRGNSGMTEALLSQAVDKLSRIEKKPATTTIFKGNSMQEIVTTGNTKHVKLRKNFLD